MVSTFTRAFMVLSAPLFMPVKYLERGFLRSCSEMRGSMPWGTTDPSVNDHFTEYVVRWGAYCRTGFRKTNRMDSFGPGEVICAS
jgi:hypothetical protein